jgi:uncharacterized membrane protein YoaK (UPF0700 family)
VEPAPGVSRAIVVVLLVTAMGVQNALHRLRPALGVTTTVMTGNVTSWIVGTVTPASLEAEKRRFLAAVILVFAVGCAAGALLIAHVGFKGLVIPALAAILARSRVR